MRRILSSGQLDDSLSQLFRLRDRSLVASHVRFLHATGSDRSPGVEHPIREEEPLNRSQSMFSSAIPRSPDETGLGHPPLNR
jgi:hypothetical protein